MNKTRFLFDSYDTEKTGLISRDTFYTFLYELGKKEHILDQFNICFNYVNKSKSGMLNYDEFNDGILELYKKNFLPPGAENKPEVNYKAASHYRLYEEMVEDDEADFAKDESESEDDDDDDSDDEGLLLTNDEAPSSQIPKSSSRNLDSTTPPSAIKPKHAVKSQEKLGSNGDLSGSPNQKRHARIDDSGLSPSLSRAKFQDAANSSPTVPRPDRSTEDLRVGSPGAVYVTGVSPGQAKRPFRNHVESARPVASPLAMRSPNPAVDGGASPAQRNNKTVVMPPPLATASRQVKKGATPTSGLPNFAQLPSNLTTLPRGAGSSSGNNSGVSTPEAGRTKKKEIQITGLSKPKSLADSVSKNNKLSVVGGSTDSPTSMSRSPNPVRAPLGGATISRPAVKLTALPRNAAEARAMKVAGTLGRPAESTEEQTSKVKNAVDISQLPEGDASGAEAEPSPRLSPRALRNKNVTKTEPEWMRKLKEQKEKEQVKELDANAPQWLRQLTVARAGGASTELSADSQAGSELAGSESQSGQPIGASQALATSEHESSTGSQLVAKADEPADT